MPPLLSPQRNNLDRPTFNLMEIRETVPLYARIAAAGYLNLTATRLFKLRSELHWSYGFPRIYRWTI